MICCIKDCAKKSNSSGFCAMHYRRLRLYGNPLRSQRVYGAGRTCKKSGYRIVHIAGAEKFEHVAIVEKILGRPLPRGAVVHHVDHDRQNNVPTNFVVCPDRAYHALLHRRERALDACGNVNWRRCRVCRQYDDPANLQFIGSAVYHRICERHKSRERNRV